MTVLAMPLLATTLTTLTLTLTLALTLTFPPSKAAVIGNVRGLRELRERNRFEAEEQERHNRVSQMLAEGIDPAVR